MKTTSASGSTVSTRSGETTRLMSGFSGISLGSTPITVMPKPCARCAICEPLPPTPMMTAVLPAQLDGLVILLAKFLLLPDLPKASGQPSNTSKLLYAFIRTHP